MEDICTEILEEALHFLGKLFVFAVAIRFRVAVSFKKEKDKRDAKKQKYHLRKDWWPQFNDDFWFWVSGGILGAITAGAWVSPFVIDFVDFSHSSEYMIDIFNVMVGTLLGAEILGMIFIKKKR